MKLATSQLDMLLITECPDRLDPIRVYLQPSVDRGMQQGSIIVTCFGRAWTTWFGNIGDQPLDEFVERCNPGYLANRLVQSTDVSCGSRQFSRDEKYVLRIVQVVQAALKQRHADELAAARQRVLASNAPTLGELLSAIPPRAHKSGLTAAVRGLKVGESVEVPRSWEKAITSTALRLGIRLTARRLGKPDTTTVYRDADPQKAAA